MFRLINKCKPFLLLTSLFVFFVSVNPVTGAVNHDELFVLIGDSLMKAKEGDQATVSKNMEQFTIEWQSIKKSESKLAKKVDGK